MEKEIIAESKWFDIDENKKAWVFYCDVFGDVDSYDFDDEERAWEYILTLDDESFDPNLGIITIAIK